METAERFAPVVNRRPDKFVASSHARLPDVLRFPLRLIPSSKLRRVAPLKRTKLPDWITSEPPKPVKMGLCMMAEPVMETAERFAPVVNKRPERLVASSHALRPEALRLPLKFVASSHARLPDALRLPDRLIPSPLFGAEADPPAPLKRTKFPDWITSEPPKPVKMGL